MTGGAPARQTDPVPETPATTPDTSAAAEEPDLVALARRLATEAHRAVGEDGQIDKQGRDYVSAHLAPIAAGCALFGPEAQAAGWLHDVVEDTDRTLADLERDGVPQEVLDAVDSVTERAGEPYTQLVHRAAADPIGAIVKLVDNSWNILSNPGLARTDALKAGELLREKYLPARAVLLAATGVTALQVHELDLVLREHLERLPL